MSSGEERSFGTITALVATATGRLMSMRSNFGRFGLKSGLIVKATYLCDEEEEAATTFQDDDEMMRQQQRQNKRSEKGTQK